MDKALIPLIETDQPEALPIVLDALETLLAKSIDSSYQGERVQQLLRLQRADFFYRGIQNIAPVMDPATGNVAWSVYGLDSAKADPTALERAMDYNPRKTKSYGDKFVAVLGQRPFYNCGAEPNDPTSEMDRQGARQVNLLIEMLQGQWKVRIHNFRLFYYLFKTGTTFGFVRPVTDGRKYGYDEVPVPIQAQQEQIHPGGFVCPDCAGLTEESPDEGGSICGACGTQMDMSHYQPPVMGDVPPEGPPPTQQVPRTSVELDLLNGYIVTVPFDVVEKDKSPWIGTECMKYRGEILKAHPNARQIVGKNSGGSIGGDPTSATAATVRATSQSQTGTVRTRTTGHWNYREVWISPDTLETIEDDNERAVATRAFPRGIRITRVEGKTVAVKGHDFRERFSSCLPSMADYLFADGVSWGMFGMEDGWSNLFNIAMQTLETGIVRYLCNPNYLNVDDMNRMRYSPNTFVGALPAAGETLSNAVEELRPSEFAPQTAQMFEVIEDNIQNQLGLLPQVYGGGNQQNMTLGQARMMLNQGLMQLGTVAELATNFWEQTWTNAVKLYLDVVSSNPDHGGQKIDLDLIRRSRWVIKGDTVIPRSFSERKEMLQEILTQNPQLAEAMKVTDPVNFPALRDYMDLPDLENPAADMIEALKGIIDQLWGGQPIPQADGSMQPSVEFDSLLFDPELTASVARAELLKPQNQQRKDSPGYMNVHAFLQAAQAAIQPPQPDPPPPPKLSLSADLTKLPANQSQVLLQDYFGQMPPPQTPSVDAAAKAATDHHAHHLQADMLQQQQAKQQQQGIPPPNAPENLLQPGTPAMQDNAGQQQQVGV